MTQETRPVRGRHRSLPDAATMVIGSVIAVALVAIAAFQAVDVMRNDAPAASGSTPVERMDVNLLDRFEVEGVVVDDQVYLPVNTVDEAFDLEQETTDEGLRVVTSTNTPRLFTEHDPKGTWLGAEHNRVEEWGDVRMDEASGLPLFVHDGRADFLPITVAHYGLQHYSIWVLEKKQESWDAAVRAAEWFVENQESTGGWPANFDFEFNPPMTDTLKSGWYSAMSQGMAADLLAKMYVQTNDARYRTAALRALNPLSVPVESGGVQRMFEGEYVWWEEYPTTNRPTYVLNGFIYCLIGVYDVAELLGDSRARQLYNNGLRSLERMINLYDLGNRTSYDLLHYSVPGQPPNIARWGYHNLHVSQLSILNVITGGKFQAIQDRWYGYTQGISSPHN